MQIFNKINHYGFLTQDIVNSSKHYEVLCYKRHSSIITDNSRGINILFMKHLNSDVLLELVQPINEGSIVSNLIKKYANNLYHTCYEVNNINKSCQYLAENHFLMIEKPAPAIAFNGRKVAFFYSSSCGIIEILEENA